METISIENIIDVIEDGIIYTNNEGTADKIIFDECRKNWVEHVNQAGFADWEGNSVKISIEQSRCIGERNMIAKPPYVLLYGDVKLKIEMVPRKKERLSNVQKEFMALLYSVGKVTTFDLS